MFARYCSASLILFAAGSSFFSSSSSDSEPEKSSSGASSSEMSLPEMDSSRVCYRRAGFADLSGAFPGASGLLRFFCEAGRVKKDDMACGEI